MNPRLVMIAGMLAPALLSPLAYAATAPTGTVRVAAPGLPFAVNLPRGWVGVDFKDGLKGVSIASQAKAPAALMRFTYIPKQGKTLVLKNEFLGFEQAVKGGGTTIKLVSEKAVRYGGVNGLSHVYDLAQQGKKLRMQIWFGSGAKNFYNFQLTDQAATYSKNAPLFGAALGSVKFK